MIDELREMKWTARQPELRFSVAPKNRKEAAREEQRK
jgi:hypothetical protein